MSHPPVQPDLAHSQPEASPSFASSPSHHLIVPPLHQPARASRRFGAGGDFDYDTQAARLASCPSHDPSAPLALPAAAFSPYATHRRPDPAIAAIIHAALGPARSVLNVGAGAGSYEPSGVCPTGQPYHIVAVEPSAAMRAQRPNHLAPAINAIAESLPFDDNAFDASMALITAHQWKDPAEGFRELRRVTRPGGVIVVMTFDNPAPVPDPADDPVPPLPCTPLWWLAEYAPELVAAEHRRHMPISRMRALLAGNDDPAFWSRTTRVIPIPIPLLCTDGFTEAFYGRPERLLDPSVRAAQSSWAFIPNEAHRRAVEHLRSDLASGEWDRRHGHLRSQPTFIGTLRLVVAER